MRSYERAKSVLTEHIDVLHKLAEQLLEKETILGAEMDELIRQVRPGIQLPEKPGDKEEPHDATAAAADATVNQPDDSQSDPSQETDTEEDAGPQ
jgi:cell division protease FtsH